MLLWGPLYVTERTLRDSDHIGRMLGASLIYSPLSPGSPHAPQPWGPLCIPQEVLTVVLLACNEKPQAHVFTQLSASHRSSQDTWYLVKSDPTLCGWLGFIKRVLKAATPEGLLLDGADPQVLPLLYSPHF